MIHVFTTSNKHINFEAHHIFIISCLYILYEWRCADFNCSHNFRRSSPCSVLAQFCRSCPCREVRGRSSVWGRSKAGARVLDSWSSPAPGSRHGLWRWGALPTGTDTLQNSKTLDNLCQGCIIWRQLAV